MSRKDLGRTLLGLLATGAAVESLHLKVYCADSARPQLKTQRRQTRAEKEEHSKRLRVSLQHEAVVAEARWIIAAAEAAQAARAGPP